MKRLRLYALEFLLIFALVLCGIEQAKAMTIDFESFNVGDGLSQVNAITTPLGITFHAAVPSTFQVVQDPSDPGNNVLRAQPLGGAADILANFSAVVDSLSVEFIDNPGDPITNPGGAIPVGSQITTYLTPQIANSLTNDFGPSAFGYDPVTLEIVWSSIYAPPSQIRSLQMEQDGSIAEFVYVDNISFQPIPVPTTMLLLGSGLLGLAGFRRRFKKS